MKKLIIFFVSLFLVFGGLIFLPTETFSGKIIGISGDFENNKACWNTLYVRNTARTEKVIIRGCLKGSWEELDKNLKGKQISIYKNMLGYWHVIWYGELRLSCK